MLDSKSTPRVTIVGDFRSIARTDLVEAVLTYGKQTGRWQFVGDGTMPFSSAQTLKSHNADGVIAKTFTPEVVSAVKQAGVPAVSITWEDEPVDLPRAVDDDAAIGRLGAEHLLDRGFQAFAFLGQLGDPQSRLRCDGFQQAIENAGRTCHVHQDAWSHVHSAIELIDDWLNKLPKPIAIMGAQDYFARLIVNAAVSLGWRVPDDVAVLGVGDNPWMSILSETSLSSIQLDRRHVGRVAAEMLDQLMAGQDVPHVRTVPPIGVVARESTDIIQLKDQVVARALAYIRDHCTERIGVDDVVEHCGQIISRRDLERRMKRAVGLTPGAAIRRAQVNRVKVMLADAETPIETIAHLCGFSQPARLNEVFKRVTGMTPGQYRRRAK